MWENDACHPFCPLQNLDLVTANPPYLSKADMATLQKEVSFEPKEALNGGIDGLDYYRALTRVWKEKICTGGRLFYEVGMGQSDAVLKIMEQNGFGKICTEKDLCGIIRVVSGEKLPE